MAPGRDSTQGDVPCYIWTPTLDSHKTYRSLWVVKRKEGKMVLLDKMWDDVVAGPQPERGLGKLRKVSAKPLVIKEGESSGNKYQRSLSMPQTPTTPTTPTASSPTPRQGNVWRSVFNPGSNLATKTLGANLFDKPQPNSPTVYDWLYSGETKSTHR